MANMIYEDVKKIEKMTKLGKSLEEIRLYYEKFEPEKNLYLADIKEEYLINKARIMLTTHNIEELCEIKEMIETLSDVFMRDGEDSEVVKKRKAMMAYNKYSRLAELFYGDPLNSRSTEAFKNYEDFKRVNDFYDSEINDLLEYAPYFGYSEYLKEEIDFFIEKYNKIKENPHEYFLKVDKEYQEKYYEQKQYEKYEKENIGNIEIKDNTLEILKIREDGDNEHRNFDNLKDGNWVVDKLLGKTRVIENNKIKYIETEKAITLVHSDYYDTLSLEDVDNVESLCKQRYDLLGFNLSTNIDVLKTSKPIKRKESFIDNEVIKCFLREPYCFKNKSVKVLTKENLIIAMIIDFEDFKYDEIINHQNLDVKDGKVYVGEPRHKGDGEILNNLVEGYWKVFSKQRAGYLGVIRCSELIIKENKNISIEEINTFVGSAYTGGATLGFFKPILVIDKNYYKNCYQDCSADIDYLFEKSWESKSDKYCVGKIDKDKGVVASTGLGDGEYSYYVHRNKDGKIDAVRFIFMN